MDVGQVRRGKRQGIHHDVSPVMEMGVPGLQEPSALDWMRGYRYVYHWASQVQMPETLPGPLQITLLYIISTTCNAFN